MTTLKPGDTVKLRSSFKNIVGTFSGKATVKNVNKLEVLIRMHHPETLKHPHVATLGTQSLPAHMLVKLVQR